MSVPTKNAIEKIHEFQRFGSILGLERMTELLELLGNPEKELKIIHVAGTNGKGSVCRYIYSVLEAQGYKAGLYTSPFLEQFNERVEFDGNYITDDELDRLTDTVLEAVKIIKKRGHQSPTEFEVITAIAFMYFKEKNCDYVVLEVGLGGTGDSTNVCREPLMTVITSISMDHMDRLGGTIEQIAGEKAGIIKEGCPVVTGAKDTRALRVIREKAQKQGSMLFETEGIPLTVTEEGPEGSTFDAVIQGVDFSDVKISMGGRHQVENAVVALCALSIMEERGDVKISRENLYRGMAEALQPGRFELISQPDEKPVVIIDGAHNSDGAEALAKTIESNYGGSRVLMVTGMLEDKDVDSILAGFVKITKDFITTEPDNPRKLKAESLARRLEDLGGECIIVPDIERACRIAEERKEGYDVVVYAGSLYLIGKVRSLLKKNQRSGIEK